MVENENLFEDEFKSKTNPIVSKLIIIVVFLVLLLIPLHCVESTINERADYKNAAIATIAASWAKEQTISTPQLMLKNGEYLCPAEYNIKSNITTEYRKKGIFKIPVYTAEITTWGTFTNPKKNTQGTLVMNVSDINGIVGQRIKKLNGNPLGIVNLGNAPTSIPFEAHYILKGINGISFNAGGKNNNFTVSGNWKNLNFEGNYLPSERKINNDGYKTSWSISDNSTLNNICNITFLSSVDSYRMTVRCVKYGFLFIALTFLAFFLFESASKMKKIHPFQYTLIGISMVIFYMLLLSMSEFIPFGFAYLIATLMTISLISCYTYFVLTNKNSEISKTITLILAVLYIYLYTILNLQEFALLIGSLGLFFAVVAIMYYTRNIEWYKE